MSAQTGAGIQELMAAETRASQIVAEARMGKGSTTGSLPFLKCRDIVQYEFVFWF
jgi:hypothetical protein